MGNVRRDPKRDANEGDLVKVARAVRCLVHRVADGPGDNGHPDLVIWSPWLDAFILVEVKPVGKDLNEDQVIFHEKWKAAGHRIFICRTRLDILRAVGAPASAIRATVKIAKQKKAA